MELVRPSKKYSKQLMEYRSAFLQIEEQPYVEALCKIIQIFMNGLIK